MFKKLLVAAGAASVLVTGQVAWAQSQPNILNASYDVARELFAAINPKFVDYWKKQGLSLIHI